MGAKRDPAAADAPVFQDPLFSTQRTVQRTFANGTVLRLRPLPVSRVQVLTYTRRRPGGMWTREPSEEGRTLRFSQLKLPQILELFGASE